MLAAFQIIYFHLYFHHTGPFKCFDKYGKKLFLQAIKTFGTHINVFGHIHTIIYFNYCKDDRMFHIWTPIRDHT